MNDIAEARRLIEEMSAYYDRHAPWHDQGMGYESNANMEKLLEPIIRAVESHIRNGDVLEIACGTGNWTQVLAKRARCVVAVDASPAALGIARTKVSAYKNVSLALGDAYALDGVGGFFDLVFAADWWSHIPKTMIPSFLETVTGKLAHGSRVVFIDMSLNEYFESEPCYYDDDGNRVSFRRLTDGSEYRVVKNFPTKDELMDILTRYGRNVVYEEFVSLKRWMVTFETA